MQRELLSREPIVRKKGPHNDMWLFYMPSYRRIRQDKGGRDSGKRRKELSFFLTSDNKGYKVFFTKIKAHKNYV